MRIRNKKNNSYPGDNSSQVQYQDSGGQWQGLFNIWPERDRFGIAYYNDRYPGAFATITEAKEYAKQILERESA